MANRVHFDDRRWRSLLEALKGGSARVRVGILADSQHTSPVEEGAKGAPKAISMLELAAIHEFGSPAAHIPERSFIRATINNKRGEINDAIEMIVGRAMKSLLKRPVLHAGDVQEAAGKALGQLGVKVVSMMRATIRAGIAPPLKPATIRAKTVGGKRGATPLIDTGQLMNAITFAVVPGGKSEGGSSGPGAGEKQAVGEYVGGGGLEGGAV